MQRLFGTSRRGVFIDAPLGVLLSPRGPETQLFGFVCEGLLLIRHPQCDTVCPLLKMLRGI